MKNKIIIIFILIMIALVGGFVLANGKSQKITSNTIKDTVYSNNNDVQKVTLGMKDLNYYPNTVTVKANKPVEITIDESVYGCLRSFAIRELGVKKYAKTSEDKIVFTPSQKGTFTFSCSMGMGYGKLIVE